MTTVNAKDYLRDEYHIIDAERFGVVTGTGNETTNDTALQNLRSHLVKDRDALWVVNFPPGLIVYTWNRWLARVGNVVVNANGVEFKNTSTNGNGSIHRPLNLTDSFHNDPNLDVPNWANATVENGVLLQSANAGDTSLTTATASDASHVGVGKWALIHGYDQQGTSQPPNIRYFQYLKIVSVDTETGVVELDRPLYHPMESSWIDRKTDYGANDVGFGAPRILNLERGDDNYNIIKRLIINGATFLPSDGVIDTLNINGCIYAELNNIGCERLVLTVNKDVQVCGGHVEYGGAELDKITESGYLKNVDNADHLTNASGFHSITVDGGKIANGDVNLSARITYYKNVEFIATGETNTRLAYTQTTRWPIYSLRYEDCVFRGRDVNNVFIPEDIVEFTVSSVSGTDIVIDTPGILIDQLDYGFYLFNKTASVGGHLTSITFNASDQLVLSGTWPDVSASDVVHFHKIQNFSHSGCQFGETISRPLATKYSHKTINNLSTINDRDLVFESDGSMGVYTVNAFGRLKEIQCNVLSPYTGTSSGTPRVEFVYTGGEESNQEMLDVHTEGSSNVGLRRLTKFGKEDEAGSSFTDPSADTTRLMKYITEMQIRTQDMPGTEAEMPEVEIELIWRQF